MQDLNHSNSFYPFVFRWILWLSISMVMGLGFNDMQAQGIEFSPGTFEEIKALASKANKPIFMDVYTTWCGPCKKLSKEVFSVDEVGSYFNEHFVNIKVNAEKGEGIQIAREYKVGAYPTLLFLAPDGSVKHKMTGFRPYEPFLDESMTVIDPNHEPLLAKRYMEDRAFRRELEIQRAKKLQFQKLLKEDPVLAELHASYSKGKIKTNDLARYIVLRDKYHSRDSEILNDYHSRIRPNKKVKSADQLAIQSIEVDFAFAPLFDEVVSLAPELITDQDSSAEWVIAQNLQKAFDISWNTALENKDTGSVNLLLAKLQAIQHFKEQDPDNVQEQLRNARLTFYRHTGMTEDYHSLAQEDIQNWTIELDTVSHPEKVKSIALQVADRHLGYEHLDLNSEQLNALRDQALENLKAYEHPTTYASAVLFYHRLGDRNKAMSLLRDGMILGKKEHLDTQILFKLFGRMKGRG